MEYLFNGLIITAYCSLVLSAITGIFFFRQLPIGLKRLSLFLVSRVLIEGLSELSNWCHQPNLWLLHYHVLFEFILITWIYRDIFKASKVWTLKVSIGILILSGLRIASELDLKNKTLWELLSNLWVHISIIFLSCTYLYRHILIGSKPVKPYFFWINAGLLCWFSATLITDLTFSDFLEQPKEAAIRLWMVNLIIGIGFYVLCGLSFYKWRNKQHL
jgi:hypothetical protein